MSTSATTSSNGEAKSSPPEGINTDGFSAQAFEPSRSDRDIETLPEDGFADYLQRIDTSNEAVKALIKWLVRPTGVAILVLAIAVAILAKAVTSKPNVAPYVQIVKVTCYDPKCTRSTADVGALTGLSQNEQAEQFVAQTLLPTIFHQAMTISKPAQDQYDWTTYVLPFVKPDSVAQKWLYAYMVTNKIGDVAGSGTSAEVVVDPVAPPNQPNHYFVSWLVTTISASGTKAAPQRFFANVTIEWGTPTNLNQNGLYLTNIETVTPGAPQTGGTTP